MATEVTMRRKIPKLAQASAQRGAVLYVALIMLILLALIGLVGMQVTGMQERMAANYLRGNLAFQNSESSARTIEANIDTALSSGGVYAADQEVCDPIFDPLTWANGVTASSTTYTRRIDKCFPSSSLIEGTKQNEETGNIYEDTALASDDNANAAASAVINTVFIP
ncbi:MAG TPA: PilX N-terminal domain-containing pilus assembly protein [Stenotrophomonas sp.]|jgi:type IV pilus assembly protein PilX